MDDDGRAGDGVRGPCGGGHFGGELLHPGRYADGRWRGAADSAHPEPSGRGVSDHSAADAALRQFAYARPWLSNTDRLTALDSWVHRYNTRRAHSALGGRPPITRLAA